MYDENTMQRYDPYQAVPKKYWSPLKQKLINKLRSYGADYKLEDKPLSVIRDWDKVFKSRYPEYAQDKKEYNQVVDSDLAFLKPDPHIVCRHCGGGIWGFKYYGEPFFCICDDISKIRQLQEAQKQQNKKKYNKVLQQFHSTRNLEPEIFQYFVSKYYPQSKGNVSYEILHQFHQLSPQKRLELYQKMIQEQLKKN